MEFMAKVLYTDRCASSLCIMELVQGCLNKEELKSVKKFIKENICHVIHPDDHVSEKAIHLLERHAMSDGLRTIDAIIAASALVKGADLATANYKHFKNISTLKIRKFNPS
jgi:hypothetical protein